MIHLRFTSADIHLAVLSLCLTQPRREARRQANSRRRRPCPPLEGQGFLDQLLEGKLLQHRRYRKKPAMGGQIVYLEVIDRRSPNFIRLPNQ